MLYYPVVGLNFPSPYRKGNTFDLISSIKQKMERNFFSEKENLPNVSGVQNNQ